jgi:hypothetical protein
LSAAIDHDDTLLASLPYAGGAEFNAYVRQDDALCHQGTRVALLDTIMAWAVAALAADAASRRVFWLDGMAGTSKSTVARTVARRCADRRILGASFFFTRGGGDLASARKFVTTVAVQLAVALPAVKPYICRALRAALPRITAAALQDQWRRLVLEPLAALHDARKRPFFAWQRRPLVIVVDALDECDSERETAALLGLLAFSATSDIFPLRVFVTSRPETPIRYGMQSIPQSVRVHFVLHHIHPDIIDDDIAIYLANNLSRIRKEFHLALTGRSLTGWMTWSRELEDYSFGQRLHAGWCTGVKHWRKISCWSFSEETTPT